MRINEPKIITTKELLEEIVRKATANGESQCVEASLGLHGGLASTHFLVYDPDTKILYDEGCDGEQYETSLESFANDSLYSRPEARWRLWDN